MIIASAFRWRVASVKSFSTGRDSSYKGNITGAEQTLVDEAHL